MNFDEIIQEVKELSDSKEHEKNDYCLGYENAIDEVLVLLQELQQQYEV